MLEQDPPGRDEEKQKGDRYGEPVRLPHPRQDSRAEFPGIRIVQSQEPVSLIAMKSPLRNIMKLGANKFLLKKNFSIIGISLLNAQIY